MRRRNITIIVSLVVLSLSLSIIAVSPVTGQDKSLIISKLQTLSGKLEGEHPCLQNKVKAVIHQIEAGAFHGALYKLQNDVKKSIAAKVANPEELLRLVDEIIALIKGIKPSTPDFELEAAPDQLTIAQGGSATSTIVATSVNNFNKSIQLSITSPTIVGVNTTITPSTVTPVANQTANATLTVRVATDAPLGQHTIVIKGTTCRLRHSIEVELTIVTSPPPTKPDFELTANPTELSIAQGSSGTSSIKVTSKNGFNQQVNLTATTTASSVILTLQAAITPPPNSSATTLLKVDVATNATTGDYSITVTGTSSSLPPKTAIITLRITASSPDRTPPVIASVIRNPEDPAYFENVTITAFVYDTQSGVKQVVLNYTGGTQWTQVNMALISGLYQATIPKFPFHTTVEYQVLAWDNANNMASSSVSNYTVTDPVPPIARIITPSEGSFLADTVMITVFMMDQNTGGESGFATAELSINGTPVKTWSTQPPAGSDTFNWDTLTSGGDGNYTIRLTVQDKAGNTAEKTITVTVDNTMPSAAINQPTPGNYLRQVTLIKVTGTDTNFDKMEVRIDSALVQTFYAEGSYLLEWDTDAYMDGVHSVALTVYDRAGNVRQVIVDVTVDNAQPLIGTPTWSPQNPAANANITITVNVTDATPGSGIDKVTVMFKNKTLTDWRAVPMQLDSGGNWTAALTNQSDTTITFFVEASDRAGNSAETQTSDFTVAAPTGVPLAWIIAIIAAIAAIIGGTAYYEQRRRRKGSGATAPSTPTPAPS